MTDFYDIGYKQGLSGNVYDSILGDEYQDYANGWKDGRKNKEDPQCCKCAYYRINPQNLSQGACTRFPPIAHPIQQQSKLSIMTIFPVVKKDEFCGEYKYVEKCSTSTKDIPQSDGDK